MRLQKLLISSIASLDPGFLLTKSYDSRLCIFWIESTQLRANAIRNL